MVEVGNRMGSTGYIDRMRVQDFPIGSSVVRGVDKFQRPFVSFLYVQTHIIREDETKDDVLTDEKKRVFSFFQRYTDNPNFWQVGGQLPLGLVST